MTTKTAKELDEMRKERDINLRTLSACAGGSNDAWGQAVRGGNCSDRFKENVVKVFKFYDQHGYVPIPGELDLEPLGVLPKS